MKKRETRNAKLEPMNEAVASLSVQRSAFSVFIPWIILIALLTILCVRLSMTEALRQNLAAKYASLEMLASAEPLPTAPEVGPGVTTGCCMLTLFCAAAASFVSRRTLTRTRLLQAGLIAGVVALGLASTFHATNRFAALVGLTDLLTALAAGWTISLLCAPALLGDAGRRFVLAALIALLAAWCLKGLLQRFDEIPTFQDYYQHNKEAVWAQQGFHPGDPAIALFEGRINSGEVGLFVTLANVAAAGLIGLIATLAGVLLAALVGRPPGTVSPNRKPALIAGAIGLGILLFLAPLILTFTLSKGGTAAAALCIGAIVIGTVLRKQIARFRRALIVATLAAGCLGAVAVVAYGTSHDALPSRSLLFRWHYWTASVPLIQQSPLLGVGLNNFGEYYGQFKRPSAPEDVKDPHSFFVRLAAEMGLPATLLIAGLLLSMFLAACRKTAIQPSEFKTYNSIPHPLIAATSMIGLTWTAHFFLAEPPQTWFLYISVFYALAALLAYIAADALLSHLSPAALRIILLSALVGALGMFLYDQINMALVTGPVAMLFWTLLGLAASTDSSAPSTSPVAKSLIICHSSFVIAAAAAATGLWFPIADGDFSWDPAPYEWTSCRALRSRNNSAALAALDEALARNPRSLELLRRRIQLEISLKQSVADDIRKFVSLDRANARPRIDLATTDSDLPAKERIALLEEAVRLDAALAADEAKKLTPADHAAIKAQIEKLSRRP